MYMWGGWGGVERSSELDGSEDVLRKGRSADGLVVV
eukprot:CAMPEP_0197423188 /NCGR_PEP_ID=MMETSP1170-20131217/19966_1 /TAXON_ID=54406 /ORGANISM="Sarcinochrysis sp, Strain CCMP770" /LENGTH=35 /DNA_ID= /DNA_START= /DNA_END= /DNA_ORIENTATION=